MAKEIVAMPVEAIRKGHYVSRLDRPWVESPFLFQGFEIESEEDLSQLKALCKVVYVEMTAEEAAEVRRSEPRHPPAPRPADLARMLSSQALLSELARDPSSRRASVPVKDPVPLKEELTVAEAIYSEANATVSDIFDQLSQGTEVDAKRIGVVVASMADSVLRNREAMGWFAQMKDKDRYLYGHALATAVWALAFGRHLGLDRDMLRSVATGALLLDIGKTQMSADILRKPQKPDAREWELLKKHVPLGMAMVEADSRFDDCVKTMIRTHHERYDGSGYPEGLAGDEIPFAGRIAGIVDCYDAMTSERAYAKGRSTYQAVRELKSLGKSWFQPELIELFIQAVGVFPTGSLVELNTGEVGVVTAQSRFRRLLPEIMLILDPDKRLRQDFTVVDLQMMSTRNESGRLDLWITQGLETGAYGIDPAEYFL